MFNVHMKVALMCKLISNICLTQTGGLNVCVVVDQLTTNPNHLTKLLKTHFCSQLFYK